MLNGDFARGQASALASRIRSEVPNDTQGQVRRALRLALAGPVDAGKVDRGMQFMDALQAKHGVTAEQALDYFCLMVLNLNEFVYLD